LVVPAGTNNPIDVKYFVYAQIGDCLGEPIPVSIRVNPIPNVIIGGVPTLPICSGETTAITLTGAVSGTVFSWQVIAFNGVSGFSNGTGSSIANTLETTGLSQGFVTYRITPTLNGCTGTAEERTVFVNPRPTAIGVNAYTICSGANTPINVNAFSTGTIFDWTVEPTNVIGATNGSAINGANGVNITQQLTATSNSQGKVVYTITPKLNGCSGTPFVITVFVNPAPTPKLTDGVICIDQATGNTFQNYVFDAGLSGANHTFEWKFINSAGVVTNLVGNGPTYEANQVGKYTVVATNTITGCVSNVAIGTITSSFPATGINVTVSEAFTENSIVTVTVVGGTGNYLYQLGEGVLQTSNVFENVPSGVYLVKVIDTQGCTYLTKEVTVINYMPFFTPNGDGYNDTWKISDLNQEDAKIYIFDRYGKLIKQISGSENAIGWNGTYNGQPLPADDYWFTITFKENNVERTFKAHFALKR
jgi:gliding motility-associated-like protein